MTTLDLDRRAPRRSGTRTILATLSALSVLIALAASPALAMPNNGGGSGSVTKDDLEKDGWKCVVSGVGFWVCSKPGHKDQWCDTHSCGPAPMRTHPGLPIYRAPITGGVLTH